MVNIMANKVKAPEVLKTINNLVKELAGIHVKNFSEYHELVQGKVNPYLNQYGLEYTCWAVIPIGNHEIDKDVFTLKIIHFQEDKRCKHHRQGWIASQKFEPSRIKEYMTGGDTLQQYLNRITKANILKQIKELEGDIIRKEKEVAEYKRYIEQLKFNERML